VDFQQVAVNNIAGDWHGYGLAVQFGWRTPRYFSVWYIQSSKYKLYCITCWHMYV